MSNYGPGAGGPDRWNGPTGDGYPPAAAPGSGGWAGPPTAPRSEPPGPRYEPPTEHYGPPTDRYALPGQRHEPQPGWAPPVPGPPGPGYPGPGPERPKRGRVPLLVVLAVVLVLVLGAAAVFWGVSREGGRPSDEPVASAPPAAEPTVATTGPTATPAPASSTDPRFVKTGQCVRNDGGAAQPKLAIAECGPQTYQVVRRFDGATSGKRDAEAKCAKVPGYTDWYFFDSELDTLDFVLCLKRR